jgi:hypothetical protein
LTQQFSSHVSSPASHETIVENPVLVPNTNSGTGIKSLQERKDRFAQWGACECPKIDLEKVHPCKGVTIISCQVCQKENGRKYD